MAGLPHLKIETESCVTSEDNSFKECYPEQKYAEIRGRGIIDEIKENKQCWDLINSNDTSWGRNGINHLAISTARGHTGQPYAKDNFNKQYNRFKWVIVHRKEFGSPEC